MPGRLAQVRPWGSNRAETRPSGPRMQGGRKLEEENNRGHGWGRVWASMRQRTDRARERPLPSHDPPELLQRVSGMTSHDGCSRVLTFRGHRSLQGQLGI